MFVSRRRAPTSSGAFSGPLRPARGAALAVGTWNARALMHCDEPKLRRKCALLRKALLHADVFCVQETHGTLADFERVLWDVIKHFHVFVSTGDAKRIGG